VDPVSGALYAVWQGARFNGFDEIAYSQSTDGGLTWTPPVKINLTPGNANPLRRQAFLPSVAAAGGLFLGDYVGLASDGKDFLAFFTQVDGTDTSSGFFRRAGPSVQ
jgi:hypothetical protein